MILRRLGGKGNMANEIQKHFPPHKIYVEPFFGAGGMFFNKPKAHNNILNDLDSDVFNLFKIVMDEKNNFKDIFKHIPIHLDLFKYWLKTQETDPIKKALRFLYLSNFGYLGAMSTLDFGAKKIEYQYKFNTLLDKTSEILKGCQFNNNDFEVFLKSITFINDGRNDRKKTFIYADPPYVNTKGNYDNFKEDDFKRLLDCLIKMDCKFAISEFNNDFVINECLKNGLNVIYLKERHNIKNKRVEILVTNYENKQTSLF